MSVAIGDLLPNDAISAVRKPLSEASLLPPMVYSSEAIFELERQRIFAREWLPVCHSSQLPETGSYVARNLLGEPVVAVRDRAGQIQVYSNVCRHRNMRLTSGAGKCIGGRITCPYHGWSYGLDGRLIAAPYMDQTADFRRENQVLPRLRMETWQGFVFVNFDGDAPSLLARIGGLNDYVGPYRFDEMVAIEMKRLEVDWNWKVSLENFSEAYHQPCVHPETAEAGFPAEGTTYYDNDGGPWSAFFIASKDRKPMKTISPAIQGMPAAHYIGASVFNIYPYFHALCDPGMALWLNFDIKSSNRHELCWHIMMPRSSLKDENRDELVRNITGFFDKVLAEDVSICRGVGAGTGAKLARAGRLSYMEKAVHQFHNWWLDQAA